MTIRLSPLTDMPATPTSQPLMTSPAPSLKREGLALGVGVKDVTVQELANVSNGNLVAGLGSGTSTTSRSSMVTPPAIFLAIVALLGGGGRSGTSGTLLELLGESNLLSSDFCFLVCFLVSTGAGASSSAALFLFCFLVSFLGVSLGAFFSSFSSSDSTRWIRLLKSSSSSSGERDRSRPPLPHRSRHLQSRPHRRKDGERSYQ